MCYTELRQVAACKHEVPKILDLKKNFHVKFGVKSVFTHHSNFLISNFASWFMAGYCNSIRYCKLVSCVAATVGIMGVVVGTA